MYKQINYYASINSHSIHSFDIECRIDNKYIGTINCPVEHINKFIANYEIVDVSLETFSKLHSLVECKIDAIINQEFNCIIFHLHFDNVTFECIVDSLTSIDVK